MGAVFACPACDAASTAHTVGERNGIVVAEQ